MAELTITYEASEGILLAGTSKGDGTIDALRAAGVTGWKWSRCIGPSGSWYVQGSRDSRNPEHRANWSADVLRAAGHTVTVELDVAHRPTAEVEADRAARAEERIERRENSALRLASLGAAKEKAWRERAELIPLGQPIIGYRDANRRRKIHAMGDSAFRLLDEAKQMQARAAAAAATQDHHLRGDVTERRVAKLEAERRDVQRRLDGAERTIYKATASHPAITEQTTAAPPGDYRDRLIQRAAKLDGDIDYWLEHLAVLAATGVYRLWGEGDFTKGDYCRLDNGSWYQVARVNRKTLSVADRFAKGRAATVPYNEIREQHPAEGFDETQHLMGRHSSW